MDAPARIVIAQPVDDDIVTALSHFGDVRINPGPEPLSSEDLAGVCREAEALMAFMTERIDADFLAACPKLKVIAGALKGYDNIDVAACSRRNIAVTIVPDLLTAPTAELALGLMIAVSRNLLPGDKHVRSGTFAGWRPRYFGSSIQGATVGVIGAGRVGRAILKLLTGFGCHRLYHDLKTVESSVQWDLDATPASLEKLSRESDFVVLALPLTDRTSGLVDETFLARMKPGAYLINPARGSLVNEAAVAAALESGRLAGYAADVFETEDWARPDRPSGINSDLLSSAKTVLTPHLGSAVTDVRKEIVRSAANSISEVLQGRLPDTTVNEEAFKEREAC